MRIAFKEWAVIVDSLGAGEQILILRKGGISEGRGGFQVEHSKFWLFPTGFHQQRDSVLPTGQRRFDQMSGELADTSRVRVQHYAEVAAWERLESLEMAEALRGQHIWRDEVIAQRFDWGRAKNIFALAVRVYQLAEPRILPMQPTYGGCKSWIEFDEEISTEGSRPVLSDDQFSVKLEQFRSALRPATSGAVS